MAKVVFVAFCQAAVIDSMTNNLSIINQFDELHPSPPPALQKKKGVPVAALQCALASVWEREKPEISETLPVRIRLIGPNKASIPIVDTHINLKRTRRARLITNLPGLPIVGEGTYMFVYEVRFGTRWKRAGDVSFLVTYNTARPSGSKHH